LLDPFPAINTYNTQAAEALDAIYNREDDGKDDDERVREENERIDALQEYQAYLKETAQLAFVKQRAEEMEDQMRHRYIEEDKDPINVFSISASMYLEWLKVRQKDRPILTPEMTGIPALRRFLIGLAAEQNWQIYRDHAFEKLPLLLDKLRRIVQNENKNNAYDILRPRFKQAVAELREQHQISFDNFLKDMVFEVWTKPSREERLKKRILNIGEDWGTEVRWNTYNKVLRERGLATKTKARKYLKPNDHGLIPTFGKINWNEEISKETRDDMEAWKRKENQAAITFARALNNVIIDFCEKVLTSITTSSLTSRLKQIAVAEWTGRQSKITAQSKRLERTLKARIELTYQYATTETDTRCMLTRINLTSSIQLRRHQSKTVGMKSNVPTCSQPWVVRIAKVMAY
jgi:hypothetical protein